MEPGHTKVPVVVAAVMFHLYEVVRVRVEAELNVKVGQGLGRVGDELVIVEDEQLIAVQAIIGLLDRKSTRLNSSHLKLSRMPSSA